MADTELDVRQLRKPDKHPTIFATYAALAVGESFVLVNNHDPKHLHEEFEADHAGSYGWEYLEKGPAVWRIRITKLTSTPLPRILVNTAEVTAIEPDVRGAVWKLEVGERDLDSNIIALAPGGGIDAHAGADVDVLIHVLAGSGQVTTEQGEIELAPGALLWLPRRSRRQFSAGPDGLRYLTVHKKREILPLTPTVRQVV
ncbi:DUF2249 domain-containing protein [Mycobacterium heckeshornense]|nr:DUF2249 domain-containing protein [Mycobacterium heckeshornense]KMV21867.1 hypothetical protein ACT16_14680 [Mycobacterium heckeshornense]MCV7035832.1 DUF2249 domain-containing protein [Mycobacterium heckeshornense]PIJ33578.1 DUF2249 domain-containing protein [Mycobacterium heckeshornense]